MKGQMMHHELTLHAIIEYGNRVFPYKEIVTKLPDASWHRYTFADMYRRTKKLSNALINKLHIKPADRVATFAWNHYQHMELYYGIPGAGAICHPLNIRLSADQIAYIINHADDQIIFIDATLVKLFESIAPRTPGVKRYVLLNAPANIETSLANTIHYEDLLADADEQFEWYVAEEEEACVMCYTSGTTGDPKGVLYSHRAIYLHTLGIMQPNAMNASAKDTALLIVPQFHVMAWGFPFLCIMAGAKIVLPSCHLQPQSLIDIIQKEKVTIANGVPAIWMGIYEALKKNPPAEKLPLREYIVGGSALPLSLIEGFERDFGIPGIHAWGMTETSPLGTICRLQSHHQSLSNEDQLALRAKQGIEIAGVEIRALKDDGSVAERDGETVGEFEIKGAWVLERYYNSDFDHNIFFKDGWFKTGDVGTIDSEGYMMITDRKKDLIKSGGEWISSIALELALVAHPFIKEACVIAIPHERWGERPLACIVFNEDKGLTSEELKVFLLKNFCSYQLPDEYISLKEIPKTSVGKLDKKELRRLYANGELG